MERHDATDDPDRMEEDDDDAMWDAMSIQWHSADVASDDRTVTVHYGIQVLDGDEHEPRLSRCRHQVGL